MSVPEVPDLVECHQVTVREAVHRFQHGGFDALDDAPRPGRPSSLTGADRKALAELPDCARATRGRQQLADASPRRYRKATALRVYDTLAPPSTASATPAPPTIQNPKSSSRTPSPPPPPDPRPSASAGGVPIHRAIF
jgi:hypothetical protein